MTTVWYPDIAVHSSSEMATMVLPLSVSVQDMTIKVQQAFGMSMVLQFGATEIVLVVPNVGNGMDLNGEKLYNL